MSESLALPVNEVASFKSAVVVSIDSPSTSQVVGRPENELVE
jgi:hypothetical protein